MTKHEKLLRGLSMATANGIEIGALDKPVVPPSSPNIFYVDYADTQTLRRNYRNDPNVNIDNLVEVSGIWGQKTLAEIAAPVAPVDFVVASHVIEHVPDLITWLNELASVLKPGGEVRLAIPDKRFSFDVLRAETQYTDVLTAWLARARVPQARAVIDHVFRVTTVDCAQLWDGTADPQSLVPNHSPENAEAIGRDVLENGNYHDVHCWVFTPRSFTRLMSELADAGHLKFKCAEFIDTEHNTLEFFTALKPCDDRAEMVESWKSVHALLTDDFRALAEESRHKQELARACAEIQSMRVERDCAIARAAELEYAVARVAELEQAFGGLRNDLAEIKASRSWRLTAPLRALASAFRG